VRAIAVVVVVSLSCSPRARIVSGTAIVAGVGVGAPLAHECTPTGPDDCGAARYAMFIGTGAALGAVLGLWVHHQWRLQQLETRARTHPAASRRAVPEPVTLTPSGADDEPVADLPGSPLGGYAEGDGVVAICVDAKRAVGAALEARCAYEHRGGLDHHTILEASCTCNHVAERDTDTCFVLADATCAEPDAAFLALGFARARRHQVATARAERDARATCVARGGTAGVVTSSCTCADEVCGCAADAACSPARGVP
jgi:hypothetical protein